MVKNLVIVESPAKARTIEKFLGKEFIVKSCNGHIRDLAPNKLSIKVDKNFEPEYFVLKEKQKIVKELKDYVNKTSQVWLATDEDREGEAISWHLFKLLNLNKDNTKRIVFHEITKTAILDAIESPRQINDNLVDAQQARRVLDRLVGFKLSPILWKKIKPALSAGRVQSVAVRLIVEREREILNFDSKTYYRASAEFRIPNDNNKSFTVMKAELSKRFDTYEDAKSFMEDCLKSSFTVDNIETKATKKSPAPPFTTSTLQQEANRKLGFSVAQTMKFAQTLYEGGHITYMRTDSVKLSNLALSEAKNEILKLYGQEYSKTRNFTTKSKSAQEAHEAIRPTNFGKQTLSETSQENRLYELIWKRTVASQMSEAQLEKTNIKIKISNNPNFFTANGEVIKFDGFLKLYMESFDEENDEEDNNILPLLSKGQVLDLIAAQAIERATKPLARYSEALLVKKMEELGIGRPSTYAPTISTIQKRDYVIKNFKKGTDRSFNVLILKDNKIEESKKTELFGAEKTRLHPSSMGMIVNDFLVEHFNEVLDYNFTAKVEDEFDEIANGKLVWQKMIEKFYKDFEPIIELTTKNAERSTGERTLGTDPETKAKVYAKFGRYGSFVQLGDKEGDFKPKYAKLKQDQLLENITLEEALDLLQLPRELGNFESSQVVASIGKFGPYVMNNKKFYSLPKEDDPYTIDLDRAIEIIIAKREADKSKNINIFDHKGKEIKIINGRYGPYISFLKKSYRIPKGQKPKELTKEMALEIIENAGDKSKSRGGSKSASKK